MTASRKCLRCGGDERSLRAAKTRCSDSLFPDIKRGKNHLYEKPKAWLAAPAMEMPKPIPAPHPDERTLL